MKNSRRGPGDRLSASRMIYPFRVVGMGLGGLPVATVLHELQASWLAWASVALGCLVWPHAAYLLAAGSADPIRAEKRNLLVDSAIAGALVPMVHFNVLPSTLLITLTTVDKLSTGFRRLWLHSLPALILGGAASAALLGTGFSPLTSMPVMLACLPMLLIHMIAVSIGRYRLIRKVTEQNRELDRLRRIDTLTGLSRRGAWEEQAQQVLASRRAGRQDCMLLIDVDRFKLINDRHGHGAGDATLRELAEQMRRVMRPQDHLGRRGGDEFAILLPDTTREQALAIAERLRCQVERIRLADYPDVCPTVSIGMAVVPAAPAHLGHWLERADSALYRAKNAGRNAVMA
ncbi:diguanylate cyclase [Lysobacter sp. H21R4]|nr:diguanylate cyclase [Lysobacter sp. H21R4]